MSDHVETSLSTPSHAKNLSTASDAWTVHIDRIRRLYIEDGHVLDDVMRIMEREHNFYATRKSYKIRLRKFGLRKNVMVQEEDVPQVMQLVSQAKKGKDPGAELHERVRLATGQVVDVERLRAYLRRRKTQVDPDAPPSPEMTSNAPFARRLPPRTSLIPPTVEAPDIIRLPELVFAEIKTHVSIRFSTAPVTSNEEIVGSRNPLITQAHTTIEKAANLLAIGNLEEAISRLKLVPRHMEILLSEQEVEPPSLQLLIWKTGISLIASASLSGLEKDIDMVVKSLFRYLEYLSLKSTSLSPQIRNILGALSALSRMDGPWMQETAFRGLVAMLDYQDLQLGPHSLFGPLQKHNYDMFLGQKWIAVYNHVTWNSYRRIREIYGEVSFEGISALYVLHMCKGDKFRSQPEGDEFRLAVHSTLRKVDEMEWTQADADQEEDCAQSSETSYKHTVKDLPGFLNMLHVLRSAFGTGEEGEVAMAEPGDMLSSGGEGVLAGREQSNE